MSQSPDVCEIGGRSSQLCFKVLYLFLGFKDFRRNFMSFSFRIAPHKGLYIFVLKEDFSSNFSFPGFIRKNKCCGAFDITGNSDSHNHEVNSVWVCLFLLYAE